MGSFAIGSSLATTSEIKRSRDKKERGWDSHLASAIKKGAVLAGPGKRFVTLAQIRVLDGVLDVVVVGKMSADLKGGNENEDGGERMQCNVSSP